MPGGHILPGFFIPSAFQPSQQILSHERVSYSDFPIDIAAGESNS
jgi:hypothetical protein